MSVVLSCVDLGPTMDFFRDRLGFRVDVVFPADDPRVAELSGYGLRVRLDPDAPAGPGALRLTAPGRSGRETAPNGTVIDWASDDVKVPDLVPSFSLSRAGDTSGGTWGTGRAGMQYRDLAPGRQGGRFIASHIRIPEGGPVADWVHFHEIRFQLIVVRRGWVEVVYEDQGEPFVLEAGDCVTQPPGIRHRVLRSSPGLEVVEIGCPAEHRTVADHELELPTPVVRADRDFAGQRFVRHVGRDAPWAPWRHPGFERRETGVEAATDGLAGVRFVRPDGARLGSGTSVHDAEFAFTFVLDGGITLAVDGAEHRLAAADAVVVPGGAHFRWSDVSADCELLDVTLPARI